jgi:CheY-like chemotaxis protein
MMVLPQSRKSVLVIDDDRDVAEIVQTILLDEGFKVTCLYEPNQNDVKAAIAQITPDCVLLDGGNPAAYGPSWELATWLATLPRPIPAVMITGHDPDREEAILNESDRAKAASISAVIPKPFDIDQLIKAVRHATGQEVTVIDDRQEADNQMRLLDRLRVAGASELTGSKIGRVWATFRARSDNTLYKIYRWRGADVYFVGRYSADGGQLEPLGQFGNLEALIAYCLGRIKGLRLS